MNIDINNTLGKFMLRQEPQVIDSTILFNESNATMEGKMETVSVMALSCCACCGDKACSSTEDHARGRRGGFHMEW